VIEMQHLSEHPAFQNQRMPLLIRPVGRSQPLADVLQAESAIFEEKLLEHGALLFRGFSINSVSTFDGVVQAFSSQRMGYVFRSTPRTAMAAGIFTATEYPPEQEIPLHSENAYQRTWPMKLAFCCLTPAASGGATPIADMRRVTAALDPKLLNRFESRRIRYVRHYRPYLDLPWQTVFQTDSPSDVARFCGEHGLEHRWLEKDVLQTTHACQGVAYHPRTNERLLFNQAHLFHASSLGPNNERALINLFGRNGLPRHALYGDGEEIPLDDLESVRIALRAEAVDLHWQTGDVLLVDNMQVAHGRRPFSGQRRVLAALLEPYSPPS
jgi:alpha-ketoglutarate-dependent taurine dioxygenase